MKDDFDDWIDNGHHSIVAFAKAASTNAASSGNTTTTNATATSATVCPDTKKTENVWMSWQRSRRDCDKYPVLSSNREYTDWFINIERQFEEDRYSRVIDNSFTDAMVKWGPDDTLLYKAKLNHMSILWERVLQTIDGKRFTRKHKANPHETWKLHELHQRSSAANATITAVLSQELANLKVTEFTFSTYFLDIFDSKLEKFNKISQNHLPPKMATIFLMAAFHGNSDLRNAWATKITICESQTPPTIPMHEEYFYYFMFHSKQLEASVINNTSTRIVNSSETDYLTPNSPSDTYFSYSSKLSNYMGNQDVDMVQCTLECNQEMKKGRPRPPQKPDKNLLEKN